MRAEFHVPAEFTRQGLQDVLGLVGVEVPMAEIDRWTKFELVIAYDWAWRKHLVASDHPRRLLRDKPEFVRRAQLLKSQGPAAALPIASIPQARVTVHEDHVVTDRPGQAPETRPR